MSSINEQNAAHAAELHQIMDTVSGFITNRVLEYPGFMEWRSSRLNKTLSWGDGIHADDAIGDFVFEPAFMRNYEAVQSWLRLHTTATAVKDCEFYFRRYPFRGLPVTRDAHLRYTCEMWFSRIYEFKERLKTSLNSINAALSPKKINAGFVIKEFSKSFDDELRMRNQIHHHRQFDDIALEKVSLTQMMSTFAGGERSDERQAGWKLEHQYVYRRTQQEWAARVRKRGTLIDAYVIGVGKILVNEMPWLTDKHQPPSD